MYIYENKNWPSFEWDDSQIITLLSEVRRKQGELLGKMSSVGFELRGVAELNTLTEEIQKSSSIEGEILSKNQIRSSMARKMQLNLQGLVESSREIDGVVEILYDAVENYNDSLTAKRLFKWHKLLFPYQNRFQKIEIGKWRDDTTGPMQLVSGALGMEVVHFQAPHSDKVDKEMRQFLSWVNKEEGIDPVLKAGIAHFWFVTIHPFEDGNGRLGRVITEILLARADKTSERFYSMSSAIRAKRKEYYRELELASKGSMDITSWLIWFLKTIDKALRKSEDELSKVISKHDFWNRNAHKLKNERQKTILNSLLGGFEGNLTTSKWAKITKCSTDTALRDIQDLMDKGILKQSTGGGRSTKYELIL